ncbi:MAG: hypothetical protein FJ011_18895 [Chloroflexi bacterium]|nr:hypothetical protein [Chloroflexota bacterium]
MNRILVKPSCNARGASGNLSFALTLFLVLVGVSIFALYMLQFLPFTMDDAFITFRYARNFVNGHGMVFNANEYPRAEGITSPLYAALLAIPIYFGLDVLSFSKWLGIAATAVSCGVLFAIIRRLINQLVKLPGNHMAVICGLGILIFLSDPYVAGNAVSGMETALAVMAVLLFVSYLLTLLTQETEKLVGYSAGILALMGLLVPLLRPEWALFVVTVFVIASLVAPRQKRAVRLALMGFCFLGAIYFTSRFLYYGLPFPLPFYLKQGTTGLSGWRDMYSYLRQIFFLLPLAGFVLLWLVRSYRQHERLDWLIPAIITIATLIQGAYYLTIRHVMGMGFRFFQPIHTLMIALACLGAVLIWDAFEESHHWRAARIAAIGLMIAFVISNVVSYSSAKVIYVDRNAKAVIEAIRIGKNMKVAAQGRPLTIAVNDCGAIPFYSDFKVIDLAGLNNRQIALNSTPAVVLAEIANGGTDLVFLVSNSNHGLTDLRGYEELTSDQVQDLGFHYIGSVRVNPTYFLLMFGQQTLQVDDFAKRFSALGSLELAPSP